MAAKTVLFFLVFVILCKAKEKQIDEEWQKEQFPNPTTNIIACGRGGKVSWICDPDKILSYETADFVDELLFSVRENTFSGCRWGDRNPGFQIGVAVMKKMRPIPGKSIAVTAEKFAKHLHDRWGVGKVGCDDGAVLLLSISDRQIYVSTGRRAMMVLTNRQINFLFNLIEPFLDEKMYDTSVKLAVERMVQVFSETKVPRATETNDASFLIISVGIVFVALVFCYLLDKLHSRRDQLQQSSFSESVVIRRDQLPQLYLSPSVFESHGHFGEIWRGFGGGGSIGGGGLGRSW